MRLKECNARLASGCAFAFSWTQTCVLKIRRRGFRFLFLHRTWKSSTAEVAGRLKFIVIRGAPFRHRNARLHSLRLETRLSEDDMPAGEEALG